MDELMLGQKNTSCQDLGLYPFLLSNTFCSVYYPQLQWGSINPLKLEQKFSGIMVVYVYECAHFWRNIFSHHLTQWGRK